MVHVFTLGNFSGELRRKDCLCGTGHFFLDFADLAQQVGPLLSRGIGSLAALTRLCSSPNALTSGAI